MDDKIDKITDILTRVQVDLAEIRKDVNYHILRTNQNDEKIEMIAEAIKPIQNHVALVSGMGKIVAWGTGLAAAIATVYAAIK